jgi:hypothetical protein
MSTFPKSATLAEVIDEVQKKQPPTEPENEWREEAIRARVLAALGRPAQLLKVSVVPLWDNHFRVNVWTGPGTGADGIPNSYFVTADYHGAILRSEPPISKQY